MVQHPDSDVSPLRKRSVSPARAKLYGKEIYARP